MSNRNVARATVMLFILIVGFWMGILLRLKQMGDAQGAAGPLMLAQFVDVGDGDSAIIHSPDGLSILIDAGPDQSAARKIVLQALRLQIGAPQAIILTSARARSIGGLPYLLEHMPVHCPIVIPCSPQEFASEGGANAQADLGEASNLQLRVLSLDQFESSPLQSALANSKTQITLVPVSESGPSDETNGAAGLQSALAVRLDYGASSVLYSAGLDSVEEDKLIADRVNLPCDVLAATDSAAADTLSNEFLALTGPKLVVISTSADSPPDEQVLARLSAADATVDRTDLMGTVTLGLSDEPTIAPTYYSPAASLPVALVATR